MAIAYVKDTGEAKGASVDSLSKSFASLPSAGNFIAVLIANYDGGTPNIPNGSVTDNQGNTYVRAVNQLEGGTGVNEVCIFYAENIGAPSGTFTITVNPTGTTSYLVFVGVEFSGVETSSSLDKTASTFGTSNAPVSGTTAATTQADELVLAATSVDFSTTDVSLDVPATTGYTNIMVEQNSNDFNALAADYKVVSATGVQSAAWGTLGGSYPWVGCIATFKAATGGAASIFPPVPRPLSSLPSLITM